MSGEDIPAASLFYIAEMITHNFIFKGVGRSREEARAVLLNAWDSTSHHWRNILSAQPPFRMRPEWKSISKSIIWNLKWMQAIAAMTGWCEVAL